MICGKVSWMPGAGIVSPIASWIPASRPTARGSNRTSPSLCSQLVHAGPDSDGGAAQGARGRPSRAALADVTMPTCALCSTHLRHTSTRDRRSALHAPAAWRCRRRRTMPTAPRPGHRSWCPRPGHRMPTTCGQARGPPEVRGLGRASWSTAGVLACEPGLRDLDGSSKAARKQLELGSSFELQQDTMSNPFPS